MSDISYSWNNENFTISNNSETQINSNISKTKSIIIKILIGVFLIALVVQVIFYFLVLPAKSNAFVKISGCSKLNSLQIKKISGITNETKWLAINSSIVSRKLVSCPLIASAVVEKKFPDKILISIIEREAVAILFANINGHTVPMEVDKYGVVFKIGVNELNNKLPIITGLTFNNPKAGMRINSQLGDLFAQLDLLQKKNSVLLNEISEIKIHPKKYGGFDLIIYPIKSRVLILTNKELTEDSLRYMVLLLDVVNDVGLDKEIAQIDIRGSNAVYKKRGANDE